MATRRTNATPRRDGGLARSSGRVRVDGAGSPKGKQKRIDRRSCDGFGITAALTCVRLFFSTFLTLTIATACNTDSTDAPEGETDAMAPEDTSTNDPSSSTGEPNMDDDSSTGETDDEIGEPVCCGCSCVDAQWWCAQDTCVDALGRAVEVGAEAGFLEVGGERMALGDPQVEYTTFKNRVWYAFRPAQQDAASAPLLVFFNGGPGAPTTSGLFAMNTGPKAVDTFAEPPRLIDNPYDWSAFANLMWIDMPNTGFSLPSESPDGDAPWHPEEEAAATMHVVMKFLERHPQLGGEVVPVGESYGGRRAMLIAHLVNAGDQLREGVAPSGYRNEALADELDVLGRERFGRYAMIQGAIPSFDQEIEDDFVCEGDPYACNFDDGDSRARFDRSAEALLNMNTLSEALGVDASTIEPLDLGAYNYFSYLSFPEYPWMLGHDSGAAFLEVIRTTQWFATDAGQDAVVRTPQLPRILERDYPQTIDRATLDNGTLSIEYIDGTSVDIRAPHYPDAGHAVPSYAPEAIRDDVRAWLEG